MWDKHTNKEQDKYMGERQEKVGVHAADKTDIHLQMGNINTLHNYLKPSYLHKVQENSDKPGTLYLIVCPIKTCIAQLSELYDCNVTPPKIQVLGIYLGLQSGCGHFKAMRRKRLKIKLYNKI